MSDGDSRPARFLYGYKSVLITLCDYHVFNVSLMPRGSRADTQEWICSFCRKDRLDKAVRDEESK